MKDTEKALKEMLSQNFIGHDQRLSMVSKLVLAVLKMCTVNFAQLALVLNASVQAGFIFSFISGDSIISRPKEKNLPMKK